MKARHELDVARDDQRHRVGERLARQPVPLQREHAVGQDDRLDLEREPVGERDVLSDGERDVGLLRGADRQPPTQPQQPERAAAQRHHGVHLGHTRVAEL